MKSLKLSVQRFDRGRLDGIKRTPSGGVLLPATIARTGVQVYFDGDKEVREYRPTEEVFSKESLDSLIGSPVTVGHPLSMVDPDSWAAVSSGHVQSVSNEPTALEGAEWVAAELAVSRGDTIKKIENRDDSVSEISVGYTCDLDPTPGVAPNGERYDVVQRNIRANHVALVSRARAGNQARLRLDGNQETIIMADIKKIRLDGVDYDFGSESHIQALGKLTEKAVARADEAEAKVEGLEKDLATAEAKLDSAEKAAEEAKTQVSGKLFEERVDAALAFRARAQKVLGKDYSFAGKSEHEVRLDALKKLNFEVAEGRSQAYVEAAFDVRIDSEDYTADEKVLKADDDKSPQKLIERRRAEAAERKF